MQAILKKETATLSGIHQNRLLRGYLHKTSNSFCGIKGYASLIAEGKRAPGQTTRYANKIIDEIERMEEIQRSVGDMSMTRGVVDLNADLGCVLRDVIAECEDRFENLTVLCGRIHTAQLLLPAADLAMIIRELLTNSAEAAADLGRNTRVEILSEIQPTECVALTISDDGPGMSAALLKQAADPFVTTRDGHAGIGLTRISTLMDMYELVWSLTSSPGKGTVATLETATI